MLVEALKQLRTAFVLLFLLSVLTGIFYPAVVTSIAQTFFPWRANGSLIHYQNQVVGSNLIGQWFTEPRYFWGRPSATSPFPYNAASSSASNYGTTNADFLAILKNRIHVLVQANPQTPFSIPIDLITASGSGVDPDITLYAAYYQAERIATARKIPLNEIYHIVANAQQKRCWDVLGEPRVNVLALNLALDALTG
jgi:K+-transporting ATPase ATPase C chain